MKRYSPDLFQEDRHGTPLATMIDDPTGDYIRHDDAALAALVALMKPLAELADHYDTVSPNELAYVHVYRLRAIREAVAAVAPGTTRGRE